MMQRQSEEFNRWEQEKKRIEEIEERQQGVMDYWKMKQSQGKEADQQQ